MGWETVAHGWQGAGPRLGVAEDREAPQTRLGHLLPQPHDFKPVPVPLGSWFIETAPKRALVSCLPPGGAGVRQGRAAPGGPLPGLTLCQRGEVP